MTTQTYTTKHGAKQYRPVMTANEYLQCDGEGIGFCLACGQDASCVEPDARQYTCESCGQPKVYGMAELLMMDLLRIVD